MAVPEVAADVPVASRQMAKGQAQPQPALPVQHQPAWQHADVMSIDGVAEEQADGVKAAEQDPSTRDRVLSGGPQQRAAGLVQVTNDVTDQVQAYQQQAAALAPAASVAAAVPMIPGIPTAHAVLLTEEMVGQYGSNAGTHAAGLACEQACASLSAQQQQQRVAPQDSPARLVEEVSTSPARESPVPSSPGREEAVPDWDPSQPAEQEMLSIGGQAHVAAAQAAPTGEQIAVSLGGPRIASPSLAVAPSALPSHERLAVPAAAPGARELLLDQLGDDSPAHGGFQGEEEQELAQRKPIARKIVKLLTREERDDLYTFGEPQQPALPGSEREAAARRLPRLLKRIVKSTTAAKLGRVACMLAFRNAYCEEQRLERYPVSMELAIDILDEYMEQASRNASLRQQRVADGTAQPRANDRDGETAALPIAYAMITCGTVWGLRYPTGQAMVAHAKAKPGKPMVKEMMPLDFQRRFEASTHDDELSEFERAYGGGASLLMPAAARVKDFQRTARIEFDEAEWYGQSVTIAAGVARKSKGKSQVHMRPLEWRAPLLPTLGDEPADLRPLCASMVDPDRGCVFRDFVVPHGDQHVITNAVAWANSAASHDTVVGSLRALLIKVGCPAERAARIGGHDGRHVLPEVARVMHLGKQDRELLANHRQTPTFGRDAHDEQAYRQAIRLSRTRLGRVGALASQADRYASRDAAPVLTDQVRIAVLMAIRAATEQWTAADGSTRFPSSTRSQIAAIAAMHTAAVDALPADGGSSAE